ncbi:hypothetical protein Gotri_020873 [Gossypium trilobum]|uniref:Reverse transcriptase zinc-binding domain-containing protein n=1 Tax=Gossypium trilobum TaxID=34281 RepID=A0A7J9DB48_9ROSI|nr:hypothetical protein [Gossypium trilobum]
MALDSSCGFCGNNIKDANHVLRGCIEAIPIWMRLIKQDRPVEFLSVELQDWIFRKLSDPSYFAKDANMWDVCLRYWQEIYRENAVDRTNDGRACKVVEQVVCNKDKEVEENALVWNEATGLRTENRRHIKKAIGLLILWQG